MIFINDINTKKNIIKKKKFKLINIKFFEQNSKLGEKVKELISQGHKSREIENDLIILYHN